MAAHSPVVSPIVSDDDDMDIIHTATPQDLPASQRQNDDKSDNHQDLSQETEDYPFLRQRQRLLSEEEYRRVMPNLPSSSHDTNRDPGNLIAGSNVTPINTTGQLDSGEDSDEDLDDHDHDTDPVSEKLLWDGELHHFFVQTWGQFKFEHGFEHAFQPLRGTHATRYTRVVENRENTLHKIKDLCCDVATTRNERQERLSPLHRFIAEGLKEIERYEEHRSACPCKDDFDTIFTRVWVSGQEVKVKWILLEFVPFMGYTPGSYLVRHVESSDQDYLVTEGIVPYTQEECVDRLVSDIVPMILTVVIAFVAFDPFDVNSMPQWCTDLLNKSTSALTAGDMENIHNRWIKKFVRLPAVMELQCLDTDSKFCEAAWLLREVGQLGIVYPWTEGFMQLLQDATGQSKDDLARRYTSKYLHQEALECIEDGETDRVLAYQISPFTQAKDIFDFYRGHVAAVNEFTPSPRRLARIRNAAELALPEERLFELRSELTGLLNQYNSRTAARHGSDHHHNDNTGDIAHSFASVGSGDISDTIIVVPSAEPAAITSTKTSRKRKHAETTTEASSSLSEYNPADSSSLEPPSTEQPAPVKRGRGRPKKKAGDPKGPYCRKKPASERAPSKRQKLEEDKSAKDSN